jgi:hypothetical protein
VFPEARLDCEAMGMKLIRVDDAEEQAWIYETFWTEPTVGSGDNEQMWLGGTDNVVEGEWRWLIGGDLFWLGAVDGSPQNGLYTNWGHSHGMGEPNQPNDSHDASGEDCVVIRSPAEGEGGKWTDAGCGPENNPNGGANRIGWYTCESFE